MKRKNKIISAAIIILILVVALILVSPIHKKVIPTRFIAGENMGFDLSPGNLNFGLLIPGGGGASREITIANIYKYPTLTKIKSSGEVSPCIIVSENNFYLNPSESKNITFSCHPKEGIKYGEYAGEIEIITYRTYISKKT